MKIYTRKGDQGETSLIGGTRIPKDHLRIEAYGTVDELNSWLGYLAAMEGAAHLGPVLRQQQNLLFNAGSLLAADPSGVKMSLPELQQSDIDMLEKSMDEMDARLPELKNFILPGGDAAAGAAHIARCVCRRAERLVVALDRESAVPPFILPYLNRLSDWLFVAARDICRQNGKSEQLWAPRAQ